MMNFTLKHYPCSFCKNDSAKILLSKQDFQIVKCSDCGFVYVNPRVADEELPAIYQHNYFKNREYGYMGYEQEKTLRLKNFERWLQDAAAYLPARQTIQALDVGAAAGYCLQVMQAKGWKAAGLELDPDMCKQATAAGYTVYNTPLEDFNSEIKYDLITLFDVIEHIPGIDAAFAKLNSLLADDGIVLLVTPNHDSMQRKLFGKKWFQYKPIEHIQYFTATMLAAFAERNGLTITYQLHPGQYADTSFIINRLRYYHFPFLAGFFHKLFGLLRLNGRYFYPGTGSLLAVLKKKSVKTA